MISLGNDEYQEVGVRFTTKYGKPAKVDGVPVWASDDPTIAEVRNVSADGMNAEVWTIDGASGACQVTCSGDADLGDGTRPVVATLTVEVRDPEATGAEITPPGNAKPKP